MVQLREKQNFSGFKHHAKVHSFRILLLGATLFYKPEWIRSALRTGIRAIEGVGDVLPSYWGNIVQCSNGRPFSGSITSLSMTRKGLPRVNGFTL